MVSILQELKHHGRCLNIEVMLGVRVKDKLNGNRMKDIEVDTTIFGLVKRINNYIHSV
jgi:hypothetical protein